MIRGSYLNLNLCFAEIKAVKKRKEKLKDLEGIDTSNIIVESRGRRAASAANFFAPKRVEPVDLSEDEEEEEQESDSEEGTKQLRILWFLW